MSVNGIGSSNSYIYNTKTGKLSTKDGSKDEFVDYFNGDLDGKDSSDLNGFDQVQRSGIRKMFEMIGWGMIGGNILAECEGDEIEITSESIDATTSEYYINGQKLMTMILPVTYTPEEIKIFGTINQPFRTHNATGYDPVTNRLSIGVGDVFDFGNGYRFTVEEDHVSCTGYRRDGSEEDTKADLFAAGLAGLIHFGDQQAFSSLMYGWVSSDVILEFLKEMGVDTSREFIINDTVCEIKNGKLHEVGNKVGVPSSIQKQAVERYEQWLYKPLSER